MKLAAFITRHLDEILSEWDTFAKTLFLPGIDASQLMLRDHTKEILQEIALDIDTAQTAQQQSDKSHGEKGKGEKDESAAGIHGTMRQQSGFTLIQLTTEYRALRATVFRLWAPHMEPNTKDVLDDMTRCNEAIDEALAKSVMTYSSNADRARDTFLAILGHDLRSPLSTMSMAGSYFTRLVTGISGTQDMGARVSRSSANMTSMVNDLLEYARTQLGSAIPLAPGPADVRDLCYAAMQDAQAGHPECSFALEASGDTKAVLDGPKLQQVFSNLLNNAAQYRSDTHPVTITVCGEKETITVQVCNQGPVIPAASLHAIFDPMVQLAKTGGKQKGPASSSLGLGLFIAREVTEAHGGTIKAESTEERGTVFIVSLPRHAAHGH